jgi:transcriptional antiterminator NusG
VESIILAGMRGELLVPSIFIRRLRTLADIEESTIAPEESLTGLLEAEETPVEEPLDEPSEESSEAEGTEKQEKDERVKWYVVHTYSGYENKVKANLQRRITSLNMQDKIFQVLVPTEEEVEFKDGKKKTVLRKIYPGYVLVEMIMTDDSWYVVRNTSGVTGFVGPGVKPTPLPDEEVKKILRMMGMEAPVKVKMDLRVGQLIRVTQGPFKDFHGAIEEVNLDKEKVRVLISFLGRETPVELEFSQIEKM